MTFEGLIRPPDSPSSTKDAQQCAAFILELFGSTWLLEIVLDRRQSVQVSRKRSSAPQSTSVRKASFLSDCLNTTEYGE
jgi:hypothetical protein